MAACFLFRIKPVQPGLGVLLVFMALISFNNAKAQVADVYINAGVSYSTFLRKGDIHIDRSTFVPEVGAGLSFFINDAQLWRIKAEFKYNGKGFTSKFPKYEFKFAFWGIELNALAEYPISPNLDLEGGLGVYFYESDGANHKAFAGTFGFSKSSSCGNYDVLYGRFDYDIATVAFLMLN